MNKPIFEFLVGNLLGDASIKRTVSGKAYITFEQSKIRIFKLLI